MEVWKDIPGYEGQYQVSSLGRVKSLSRIVNGKCHYTDKPFTRRTKDIILRPGRYCKSGHVSVVLGNKVNGQPVHQLVMRAFIGPAPTGQEVLHLNGDPTDNRIENLRYGTRTDNIIDVYRQGKKWRKLSITDVQRIREELEEGKLQKDIAAEFNVCLSTISAIKRGEHFGWLK